MASMHSDNSFLSSTYYRRLAFGILLGIIFLYLIDACSLGNLNEPNYHIGQDDRWRSVELLGKEQNLSAFNGELLASIAKDEKFHAFLSPTKDPLSDLRNGKIQGIFTNIRPNYLNENELLFSETFFLTGPVVIISSKAPEKGWNEERKKIFGIQKQSSLARSLEQDPSIQLKFYDDILPALADLSAQRIDGAIFSIIPARIYVKTFYNHELKITTAPLTDDGIKLAALKNEEGAALIKSFNEGLQKVKENGSYSKILERWGFSPYESP